MKDLLKMDEWKIAERHENLSMKQQFDRKSHLQYESVQHQ